MFADLATAIRVEHTEASMMRDILTSLAGSDRAPAAFWRPIGPGFATYVRPGSPVNKVIGVGLGGPIDEAALAEIERALDEVSEPTRVEIATLAAPDALAQLSARGYQLAGFENVLARSLTTDIPRADTAVHVERVTAATLPAFRDVVIDGSSQSDESGVELDHFTRETIAMAIDDVAGAHGFDRYIAWRDGVAAGGASMHVHQDVAVMAGSATRPAHRRRGVQTALLARRLHDARSVGARTAIITTSSGTQSQANVMKLGFSLMYARAVLVRARR